MSGRYAATWELPPRARRIPPHRTLQTNDLGTTSACAENTYSESSRLVNSRNYLRVRGEYYSSKPNSYFTSELPPRARRIRTRSGICVWRFGTTSACAENTQHIPGYFASTRNYLRVRGEYRISAPQWCNRTELPPRARRIRDWCFTNRGKEGTTSACAENTLNELGLL